MYRFPARIFNDIATQRPPEDSTVLLGRAAVLGGSIAGLLAARVLAEYAERVVIVERDDVTEVTDARPGVPQGNQVHLLLPAGHLQIERWFPGLTEQALELGACLATPDARHTYLDGRRKVRGVDLDMLSASRPFIEDLLRRRLRDLPNVSSVRGRATDLRFDGTAVTGVRYETPDGPAPGGAGGPATDTLDADLVVDAMGRASRLNDWLERHGWDRAPLTRLVVNINYSTAVFRRTEAKPDPVSVLVGSSPARGSEISGAGLTAVEDDRWMIMLAGYGDCRPGHDAEDMVRRCRTEFPPEFGRVVEGEMLFPVRSFHHADSRRRDFHRCRRLPAGLVSVGDAVASFNPIYGQGMSSAALHASCLSMYLRRRPDLRTPARDFFALQKVVVDAAWGMTAAADLARPSVPGPRPRGHRLTSWVADQIVEATVSDETLNRRLDEVTFMLRHPNALATPGTLIRALNVNRRNRRRSAVSSREP
ncbi:FAD-dependent monooxygenase [Plantactinospora sp. GCM10030261]|uniref:FAD-dependent monooxygenase n=1 Tax=Plantactinospora sp. GCM10030261 TaxID=3273420 RepID=UPI003617498B